MSLIFKSTENIYLCYMKTRTAILEPQSRQADAFQLLPEERRGREILLGMGWSFLTPGWPDSRPTSQELSAPCSHCSTRQPLPKSGCPLGNHSGTPPIPIYCPRSLREWDAGGASAETACCALQSPGTSTRAPTCSGSQSPISLWQDCPSLRWRLLGDR